MPITPFLDDQYLDPETRRVMGLAFEMTRSALQLKNGGAGVAPEAIAKTTIKLTNEGERNPDLLCERALNDLRIPPGD
jgi:hypothetical protein